MREARHMQTSTFDLHLNPLLWRETFLILKRSHWWFFSCVSLIKTWLVFLTVWKHCFILLTNFLFVENKSHDSFHSSKQFSQTDKDLFSRHIEHSDCLFVCETELTNPKLCLCCYTRLTSVIPPKTGIYIIAGLHHCWRSFSDRFVLTFVCSPGGFGRCV